MTERLRGAGRRAAERARDATTDTTTNWEDMSAGNTPSSRKRDVYNEQQLKRGTAPTVKKPTSRRILAAALFVAVLVAMWLVLSEISAYITAAQLGDITRMGDPRVQSYGFRFTGTKLLLSLFVAGSLAAFVYVWMMRTLEAQNAMADTTDINDYQGDPHVALVEEVQQFYDWFPDRCAHSSVEPATLVSHVMLDNKGLKSVDVVRRHAEGEDDSEFYAAIDGDTDALDIVSEPMIDTKFTDGLFEASGMTEKKYQKRYDTTAIPYNPGDKNRDKLKGYEHVSDLINGDWTIPYYEVGRPAGAYLVDTAPVNTLVLAITRAGKGQTYIEPFIDMLLRCSTHENLVVNDPKGELLTKFYVPATVRDYRVTQLNLINPLKTDIENPLTLASQAAREGDDSKVATYVQNIADVFFPVEGADDPVWPQSANNAFKRAAYGLIEYYLEEEAELRARATREGMDPEALETAVDRLWGHVTLYNCYQMFVQLTSKTLKMPAIEFNENVKAKKYDKLSQEEYDRLLADVNRRSKIWENKREADMMTIYFNAIQRLPKNPMRTLATNTDNALRAMGGAEKMMSSVYAIALSAMSFFTDPTISALTSGTPSQSVDLMSFSFPRRIGVRLETAFLNRYHLQGMLARWQAYADDGFTEKIEGKGFHHQGLVTREGWARFFVHDVLPEDTSYFKLDIVNPTTGITVRTLYFRFDKTYQRTLDGLHYVKDPVLDEKIVRGGIMTELIRAEQRDGSVLYVPGRLTFPGEETYVDEHGRISKRRVMRRAVRMFSVAYEEKPKALFMVTPPHLMSYAKLLLIILKQLVDLNFDQSYLTNENQKPDYKTYYMLDELGNLQSEGHGLNGLQTFLSIGLGQDQRFCLILQTMQQLKDVYGDSADKIIQGNLANIIFLKSNDDSMLETLVKMGGKTHQTHTTSKTVTRDIEKIALKNEGKISYNTSTSETDVVTYSDLAFLPPRNSVVFVAGGFGEESTASVIWNRNETILPMSWKLLGKTIEQPGRKYSLSTIPTMSSVLDFDVRANQPDFSKMVEKRIRQAAIAPDVIAEYNEAFGYTDDDIARLDQEAYADDIMDIVRQRLEEEGEDEELAESIQKAEDNKEQLRANAAQEAALKDRKRPRYAGGTVSREDLVSGGNAISHQLDTDIAAAYLECRAYFAKDRDRFRVTERGLSSPDGTVYIEQRSASGDLAAFRDASHDEGKRVYSEDDMEGAPTEALTVTDAFYRFLAAQEAWSFAGGRFDAEMKRRMSM